MARRHGLGDTVSGGRTALVSAGLMAWVVVAGGGCGGADVDREGPTATARRYAAALRSGDADSARTLVVSAAQPSPSELGAQLASNREELALTASAIEAAAEKLTPEALVELAGGETLVLVREAGGFRFASDPLGAGGLRTPRDAVAAFRRALARGQRTGLGRVLVRTRRAAYEAETTEWLEETADLDLLDVEIEGERATVKTPSGRTLSLVREVGEWHVAEVL